MCPALSAPFGRKSCSRLPFRVTGFAVADLVSMRQDGLLVVKAAFDAELSIW